MSETGPRTRSRILVVDDDAALAEMLQMVLRQEGFETAWCGSGERAVEAFYGQFTTGDGESLQVNEPEAEAMDASERGQERVQVKKKA